jgi:hypothetical protein
MPYISMPCGWATPTVPRNGGKRNFQHIHIAQISTHYHQRVKNRIYVDDFSQNQLFPMNDINKITIEQFQIFKTSLIWFAYQNKFSIQHHLQSSAKLQEAPKSQALQIPKR